MKTCGMLVFDISEIWRTVVEVFGQDIQQNTWKAHQGHSGAKHEAHILQRSHCIPLVIFYTKSMKRLALSSWLGFLQIFSICPSLCLWFPHASKNPPLCPYQRKTKSHAWMTGGPLLWPPSSASVLRSWSETTSALCCLLHWTHYNLHTAVTVPQTMLLPSPCTLLSPTWKIRTPMWGCCSWTTVRHLTL